MRTTRTSGTARTSGTTPAAAPSTTSTPPTRRSTTVAGIVAAGRSAGLGVLAVLLPVLLGWVSAADSGADAPSAIATALQAWLLGHHASLVVPGGHVALAPLGLTLIPVTLLHLTTLRVGRDLRVSGRSDAIGLTTAVTASYAVIATLVSLLARTSAVHVVPSSAFLGAAAIAAVGGGAGAIRASGGWSGVADRLLVGVRQAVRPAGAALAMLLGSGALLVGGSLAAHRHQAGALVESLDAGVGGGVLLGLLCLLYVPTAAIWGLAFVTGPGFAVGAGTLVSPGGTDLGAVPGLPLLAALPQEPGPVWAPMVLLVPLAAGALAAVFARRGRPIASLSTATASPTLTAAVLTSAARLAGSVGVLVAAAASILAALSAGAAGPGRLAHTGPTWWLVGPVAGAEVAVAMMLTLVLLQRFRPIP